MKRLSVRIKRAGSSIQAGSRHLARSLRSLIYYFNNHHVSFCLLRSFQHVQSTGEYAGDEGGLSGLADLVGNLADFPDVRLCPILGQKGSKDAGTLVHV
jgi:hypothetical protein